MNKIIKASIASLLIGIGGCTVNTDSELIKAQAEKKAQAEYQREINDWLARVRKERYTLDSLKANLALCQGKPVPIECGYILEFTRQEAYEKYYPYENAY